MAAKKAGEPRLYHKLNSYEKKRYQIAACSLLKKFMNPSWKEGHEGVLSVFIWHYENEGKTRLKFSKEIKQDCFSGSYNYWFLPGLVKSGILNQEYGHGYYSLTEKAVKVLDNVLSVLKNLDKT